MDLKLISYNCKGFCINKVPFINSLLNDCAIMLLQETWLYSSQFVLFQTYFVNWESDSIMEWTRLSFKGDNLMVV